MTPRPHPALPPPPASERLSQRMHMEAVQLKPSQLSFNGVLVNWQFLVSADMLHYAYLPQPALWYLSISKCPLIGSTVTVSCLQGPLRNLNVAQLTPG